MIKLVTLIKRTKQYVNVENKPLNIVDESPNT